MKKSIFYLMSILVLLSSCSSLKPPVLDVNEKLDATYKLKDCPNSGTQIEKKYQKLENGNWLRKTFSKAGMLLSQDEISDTVQQNRSGEFKEWHDNGKLKLVGYYKLKKGYDGLFQLYYSNGKLKREEFYKDNIRISGKCFDSLGNEEKFYDYQIEPSIDLEEFTKKIIYPENLKRKGIQAAFVIRVLVNVDGSVCRVLYSSSHPIEFIESIANILKETKITPAIEDGKPVRCWLSIPVKFKLR